MLTTNSRHASPRYRNPLEFSFTVQEEARRDGLLRTAFVNIVQGFSCRPEPRNAWDEAATGDLTPWKKIVHPIRHALNAAVVSGDRELIEKTLEGARAFCDELFADFASLVPPTEDPSIRHAAIQETECEGAADIEEVSLVASPTPTQAERAVGPLRRHLAALVRLTACAERLARQPAMRVAR